MPFSHHSHSGEFCSHGEGTLESIVLTAVQKEMRTLALTEHMPREERDFYPEEVFLLVSVVVTLALGLMRTLFSRSIWT